MSGHLLPSDAGWTEEKALLADLSQLNAEITRYVLRRLDVDAGRAEPIRADDEQDFGQRLIDMGERVQRRAQTISTAPVVDGETSQRRALEPSREPGRDHGP